MAVKWRGFALQVVTGLVAAAVPVAAVSAQNYAPAQPAPGYAAPPGSDYDEPGGYDDAPPPGDYGAPPPPPDYDGSQPPPPPPGYQPDPAYAAQPEQDQRYEAYAEDWAQRYCVRAPDNTGAGAVIGGLFGALVGSGLSGRHDHGTGALVGGIAGAAGGAAIGSASSNATSPGCPPGYVVQGGAPAFYYEGYGAPYYYAAPTWYRPWVFVSGRWLYRPYPYHVWYYRHWGYGGPRYGYGYRYGRPGYGRRGYGYGRPGYGRPGWGRYPRRR